MPPPQREILSHPEIAQRVQEFRNEFWPEDTVPVKVEDLADLRMRIHIVEAPDLEMEIGREAFITTSGKEIWVDKAVCSHRVPYRFRFSVAHEIAHAYLHTELIEFLNSDTPEEWLAKRNELPESELDWYEWQASEFAGLLLVPPHHLQDAVREAVERLRRSGIQTDLSEAHLVHRVAEWIGRERFNVSAEVIRRRGKRDGIWRNYE